MCDFVYTAYCAIHIVCMISYIQCVLYLRESGCDHIDTDMEGVMSDIVVVSS